MAKEAVLTILCFRARIYRVYCDSAFSPVCIVLAKYNGDISEIWRGSVRPIVMTLDAIIVGFMAFTLLEIWQIQPHVRLRLMHAPKRRPRKTRAYVYLEVAKISARMQEDTSTISGLPSLRPTPLWTNSALGGLRRRIHGGPAFPN